APDVVIIDEIHRPRLVLSHVEALTAQAPQVGIVVLTTRPDAGWLADALRAGAAAVAPAGLGPAMLERVLGEVVAGPSPLPTRLAA
ncbi:MAG: hypothetical protein QOD65_445, partial [Gaiellales bacterium]|nr:hypothetical protein [Gaiellales bacterium]